MILRVVKEFTFDAAHYLPEHSGACAEIHGHTYRLQVGIDGEADPESGMVLDFGDLGDMIEGQILSVLDHTFLNKLQVQGFPLENPTAENMVLWLVDEISNIGRIYSQVLPPGRSIPLRLGFVRLYETPTSYAEWRREINEQ